MSKHLAFAWFVRAERLSKLEPPFRAKNIAICLASAYRQGLRERELGRNSAILLRTIASEAERTGSWNVPTDLQDQVMAWVAERDGGAS